MKTVYDFCGAGLDVQSVIAGLATRGEETIAIRVGGHVDTNRLFGILLPSHIEIE